MAGDSKAKIHHEAEKFVIQGKIAQAIAEYQKIIKIDPEDVLTLNTIGDLCLRLGKPQEASTYFSKVADHYARNNFLLKAIAVYRKILSCDPQNVAVNKTLATLYAKQGLNVEARNEFLRVAEISAREGNAAEAHLAYEKVAELDPANVSAQLKLADFNLREGSKDKAHFYLVAAGRAQAKAGDCDAALNSFGRALELQPGDVRTMAGFYDASIRVGQAPRALEMLKRSLAAGFESVELLEMLAKIYLSRDDVPNATAMLQRVIALDESQYPQFFEVQKKLLELKDMDAAATCLDPIIPILIEKRATKQAIEAYQSILSGVPDHILSLTRLAELYSAANDMPSYLGTLDRLSEYYLNSQLYREALDFLEKILQVTPDSAQHLRLHRQAFEAVFPGVPYISPRRTDSQPAQEASTPAQGFETAAQSTEGIQGGNPALVEVDLLLNYGMKDRAFELLRTLESQDPSDVGVRLRLLSLYKENNQVSLAAEECLYLALAHRKTGDDEAAQKFIDEAGRLDSAVVAGRPELLSQAYQQGVAPEQAPQGPGAISADAGSGIEVDLSEDLSDIFFKKQGTSEIGAETGSEQVDGDDMAEEFTPGGAPLRPPSSLPDQLQEVDFYIRLGFYDEARVKLDELAKDNPNHPDLRLRQRQIADGATQPAAAPAALAGNSDTIELVSEESAPAEESFNEEFNLVNEPPQSLDFALPAADIDAPPSHQPSAPVAAEAAQAVDGSPRDDQTPPAQAAKEPEAKGMFADLLYEVNSLTDQEIAREEYETHYSLGIAYREMSLIDEAIKEFQGAMKVLTPAQHPTEVIQCCGMLSTCFLDKGMPRSAIRWCETGLAIPQISRHEAMALSYDMGVALAALGEVERALECFTSLRETDPNYRDVSQKIDELRGDSGRHVT